MEETEKKCNCTCEFFECGQRKLVGKKSQSGQSKMLCGWVGDPCNGSACTYSDCIKGQLRQDGSCGLLQNIPKVSLSSPRATPRADAADIGVSTMTKRKILKKLKWNEIE